MNPLTPYAEGEFESLHKAGSGVLTASQVPALFGASRWCGRYALAAHVSGRAALAPPDHGRIEAGRRLERVALEMLAEHAGREVEQVRAYARHPRLPLLASPDGVVGGGGIAEAKVVTPRRHREDWAAGPPLAVQIQHQAQFACTGAAFGAIVVLVVGDFDFFAEVHDTAPHPGAVARIEAEAEAFAAMLAAGGMPEPDEAHGSDAAALERIFAPDAAVTATLDDPEAADRLGRWRQARADLRAAKAAEEASRRWFLARIGDAGRVVVPGAGEATRRRVKVKASARPACEQTRWTIRDGDAEQEGDEE